MLLCAMCGIDTPLARAHHMVGWLRLAAAHALETNQRYLNRVMEVLVEDVYVKDPRMVKGRVRQGRPVLFEGNIEELRGKLVPVLIQEARSYMLTGVQSGDAR